MGPLKALVLNFKTVSFSIPTSDVHDDEIKKHMTVYHMFPEFRIDLRSASTLDEAKTLVNAQHENILQHFSQGFKKYATDGEISLQGDAMLKEIYYVDQDGKYLHENHMDNPYPYYTVITDYKSRNIDYLNLIDPRISSIQDATCLIFDQKPVIRVLYKSLTR